MLVDCWYILRRYCFNRFYRYVVAIILHAFGIINICDANYRIGLLVVSYKDDATAFNGEKKGTIVGKGVVNNRMSNFMFKLLEEKGVPTDFVEELNDRDTVLKKVTIVPLEVIVRNKAAGSFSKRFGVPEGTAFKCPTLEYCLKDDALGDPMINDSQIIAIGAATKEELTLLPSTP